MPPVTDDSSASNDLNLMHQKEDEEDPFDTSAIIIPEQPHSISVESHMHQEENHADERLATAAEDKNNVLSLLSQYMLEQNVEAAGDDFNAFANHRRAISCMQDADAMLPQLTSPLSPPAFNPEEIILGSNEAIAGLDSPAPIPPSKTKADAFNWLDSKMSDLKIGKKSMNALALEKQQQHQHPSR